MKVLLDLDKLLEDNKITRLEYDKMRELGEESVSSLAFNILIGFGVVAVGGSALALAPTPVTAIVIGLCILIGGLWVLRSRPEQWRVLANICILVGALMAGGGIITEAEGSLLSMVMVMVLFAGAAVFSRSSLLSVLATLMLSACVGARTGYFHASYFLVIQEPIITIILFSTVAYGFYRWSLTLPSAYERLALAVARTSVFFVNFGFWVGSLWGERTEDKDVIISDTIFSILWAIAIIAMAVWAWRRSRRWVLNTVAVFGGIHFYTQWFENLGASPESVLIAGLIALGVALALRRVNKQLEDRT